MWKSLLAAPILTLASALTLAQEDPAAGPRIPSAEITRLQDELAQLEEIESTIELRRAAKRIVRGAETLIEKHPESRDRFQVLGVVFQTRKAMFAMRQSEAYRDALLATATALLEAPDAYAEVRVEPDMLLMQYELQKRGATTEDGALDVARFADRYRGTPAEARSLMMAATVAFEQGHVVLLRAFRKALSERFTDDPLVTAFMRERFASGSQIHLSGEFRRADGKRMSFPLGRVYLACFWSQETPLLQDRIAEITAMQERYKGQFKVFSFNLDELPDSGAAALKRMGLDWLPMRLRGGVANPTYQSVGGANLFSALVVGPHGLATKGAIGRHASSLHRTYESLARSPRRDALLRSLCIGDYLVADAAVSTKGGVPEETLHALQVCFPPPPMRYRLSPADALKNYEKAETLCAQAVAAYAAAPELWRVHNIRTIARLGLWRHSGELAYLDRAVTSARAALAIRLPARANVVPHFCLATRALVADGADVEQVLGGFINSAGGKNAPGSAIAAALMLALEAHSREAYARYRDLLLGDYSEDSSAWPVSSFLFDSSCASLLFERALPGNGGRAHPGRETNRPFKAEWTTADGRALVFSGGTNDVVNAVVFLEPGGDGNAMALRKRVVDHLVQAASHRPLKDLNVVGAFRSADTNKVSAVMKQNRWSFDTVCLAEPEWQRCAEKMGVFSADLRPNVYLMRPDGSVLLALSGVSPDTGNPDTLNMRVDMALREYSLALADEALGRKDYATYAARLATSFPLRNRRRSRHEPETLAPSLHGRQLTWAYIQAGDWKRALEAADANIALQKGKPDPRRPEKWCRTCHGHLHDMCLRITLLRKMGAKKEADAERARIDIPECQHGKTEETLWENTEATIANRISNPRFQYLSDPKRYLGYHEGNLRSTRQDLFGFGIGSDLLMRGIIHEKLGNHAAAKADRREAVVRAWPFTPREYSPDLLHEAGVERRKRARQQLEAGDWERALALVNRNIEIHEGEAIRCNSMCKICWAQVQSFGFRASTLDGLGRDKEAKASRAMAELCKCPPGKELESYKSFPINRMYGGGSGVNRLNFIEGVMDGSNHYANRQHRIYRLEFAGDLVLRAEALEQLGETAKAERDRKRATALAFPLGARAFAFSDADEGPQRYEDLLSVEPAEPQLREEAEP